MVSITSVDSWNVEGTYDFAGLPVAFSSSGIVPLRAATEVTIGTKSFFADVDYSRGNLYLDGGDQVLSQEEWEAANALYRQLEKTEFGEENHVGVSFLYRLLGYLAESPKGYRHTANRLVSVPRYTTAGWARIGPSKPGNPGDPGDPGDPDPVYSCRQLPACNNGGYGDNPLLTSYCVEHGFYYCVSFDYYPNGIISGESDITVSAPAVPPDWSAAEAAAIPVWGGLDGGYTCNGRCGPGCSGVSSGIGGGGGWALGCLIHDQCVWQSTGGASSPGWNNYPTDADCGMEFRNAVNDYYMPPALCPGTSTVGGSWSLPPEWGGPPITQTVSSVRLSDSGALPLLRRECRSLVCAGVTGDCEALYHHILDQCEGCTKDFFMNATRGGLVPVKTLHQCAQEQCPGMLPGDPSGFEYCARRFWSATGNSPIRDCMLGQGNTCSGVDCSQGHCAFEYADFQAAGPNTKEETLWTYCRYQCQAHGLCGTSASACTFHDCMLSVCADEGLPPTIKCYSSEQGGAGNILVSYIHRQCVLNDGC